MKNVIQTFLIGLLILFCASFLYLFLMWVDLNQRCELSEKQLAEVKKELYEYRQETETFTDIIVNKRWE